MAGYTLYIPGIQGADNENLARVGIGDLARDRGPAWAEVLTNGPDGGKGMLCAWRNGNLTHDAHLCVHTDLAWTPAPPDPDRELEGGRYWIGIDQKRPLEPEDIERKKCESSNAVALCDERMWKIPVAEKLPHRHGIDPTTGERVRRVSPQYADFWETSQEYAVQVFSEMDAIDILREAKPNMPLDEMQVEFAFCDVWTYVAYAMAINYRINDEILDRLELLDDASSVRVICATIDMPAIVEVRDQKKTDGDTITIPVS